MKKILTIVVILLFGNIAYSGWFSSEGKLRINSNQEGAEIFIDGIKKAETSSGYTTITVSEGEHHIRIFKDYDKWYYLEAKKSLFVGKDTVSEVSMRLRQKLTVAGIERKEKKEKQLRLEENMFNSGEFKKYIAECQYCKRKDKASRNIEQNLYVETMKHKTVSSFENYLTSCVLCYKSNVKEINKLLPQAKYFESKFIDNKNGTFTSKKTNLTWHRCGLGEKWDGVVCKKDEENFLEWNDLGERIENINSQKKGGINNWRLPTIEEFMEVLYCDGKLSSTEPFCNFLDKSDVINNIAFPNLARNSGSGKNAPITFWTSSKNKKNQVMTIDFGLANGPFSNTAGRIWAGIKSGSKWLKYKDWVFIKRRALIVSKGAFLEKKANKKSNTDKELLDEKALYELVKKGDTAEITYEYLNTCKHCIYLKEVEKKYYEFADAFMGATPEDYLSICKICDYKSELKNKTGLE